MNKPRCPRRDFLRSAAWGIAAISAYPLSSSADEPPREAFTFVQLCDTQLGFGGYEHDVKTFKQAVKQINVLKPDLVFICGDLVNTPDEKSFADFNKIRAGLDAPSHCVSGNHDVGNKPTPKSLQYYRNVVGKDYHAFEHKGNTFVIVNTQLWKVPVEMESAKHDAWFKAALQTAANKKSPVFVVGHYPLFLGKADEGEKYFNLPVAKRRELLALFEKCGVVAMLGGHTHKLLINEYKGVQLVNGETTSRNSDKRPFGFRLWRVSASRPFKHDFIHLDDPG